MLIINEIFEAWITKYALNKKVGVFKIKGHTSFTGKYFIQESTEPYYSWTWTKLYSIEGKEWHRTEQGAIERAKEMQKEKITSLQKELERVQQLKF